MTRGPGTLAILLLDQQAAIEVAIACQAFGAPPVSHAAGWYDVRLRGADSAGALVPLRACSITPDRPAPSGRAPPTAR